MNASGIETTKQRPRPKASADAADDHRIEFAVDQSMTSGVPREERCGELDRDHIEGEHGEGDWRRRVAAQQHRAGWDERHGQQ